MKVGVIVYLIPEISDKIILPGKNITEYFLCKLLSIKDVSSRFKDINLEIILIGNECFESICINLSEKYKIKYHTRNHEYLMRDIISIADSYEIDLLTFLTTDCILLDPMVVANVINKYLQLKDTKLIMSVGPYKHTYPEGYDVLVFDKNYLVDYFYKKKPSWEKKDALFTRINFREDPIYMYTDETQSSIANINFKNLNLKYKDSDDKHNSLVLSIVEHFNTVYFGYLHILDYLNNHLELNEKIDYNLKKKILIREENLSTLDYLPTKWF